ncbi:hypothetical protein TRFO_20234 [Tritrichomonas foetus]|uniref:Uncharacterized protein n=1 Tax=Tritrichomonas foetus TaxID=1144522 RepID=A0A1J4KHS4_9EUKA|nr:hypothetical protein TRFO_20234 [Tritrichomonas foetus]|eukprot:OHT10480.1 hypothetical protein TRFO_20234 [Tritrichomonas foetus]
MNVKGTSNYLSHFFSSKQSKPKVVRISTPLANTPNLSPINSARKLHNSPSLSQSSLVNLYDDKNEKKDINDDQNSNLKNMNSYKEIVEKKNSKDNKPFLGSKAPSQTNFQKVEITNQLDNLQTLRSHIFKITDCVSTITTTNFSNIIIETNISHEMSSLYKKFKKFYDSASKYYGGLYEIMNQKAEDRKTNSLPIASLKANAFAFGDKWKEVIDIFKALEENGLTSLASYIALKFKSIHLTIISITTTNRRDTVHAEALLECGGKLRHLLLGINNSIQQLLLHTALHNLDPSLMNAYINDVKAFTRVYNEAHFREFPKSGCNSVDLAQFKSSVMSFFNDIIKGIRCAFDLKTQLNTIFTEVEEVQKSLQLTMKSLDLPQTIIRTVAKSKPKKKKEKQADTFEKIKHFVAGSENSIVVCSKVEEFIENMQWKLDLPLDDPNLDVWDRLKNLEESFFRKIELVQETEKDIAILKKNLTDQGKEMSNMIQEAQETNNRNKYIQKKLNERIDELNKMYEKALKEKQEAFATIEQKDKLIRELKESNCTKRNKEILDKVGRKMGELMNANEQNFEFHKDDEDIQNVEKMSVFVVEKRCQTCRAFLEMKKQSEEMLQNIIGVRKGETLIGAIERITKEVTSLRDIKAKLEQENESYADEIKKLKETLKKVLARSKLLQGRKIDHASADDISKLIEKALDDINDQHAKELAELEDKLRKEHNTMLRNISFEMDSLFHTDDYSSESPLKEIEKGQHDSPLITPRKIQDKSQKSKGIKDMISRKLKQVEKRLSQTESDLAFSNDLLKRVEKWMMKITHLSTNDLPIQDSLQMLMNAIEFRPNPLKSPLDKALKELGSIGSELLLMATRVDQFCERKTPNIPTSDPFQVLSYLSINFDSFINQVSNIKADNTSIIIENQTAEQSLRSICKVSARLLENEGMNFDEMNITQLAFQAQTFMDLISNPEDNKFFISIVDLNELTKKMRKTANIQSIVPFNYLPILTETFIRQNTTLAEAYKFEAPLATLFNSFDFKNSSYDPDSKDFSILREHIFQLHSIIVEMPESEMQQSLVHVLKYFVTISASLLSRIAFITHSASEPSSPSKPAEEPTRMFRTGFRKRFY